MHRSILALATLVGLLAAGAERTHSGDLAKMDAEMPFNFKAGDKEFPKGRCQFDMTISSTKLSIRCPRSSALIQSTQLELVGDVFRDPPRHEMIFNRYGKEYFLSEVWIGFEGVEVVKGSSEKDLRSEGVVPASVKLKIKK